MTIFKPGQMVVRKKEEQTAWQRDNWERAARKVAIDPYGPVEVRETDSLLDNLYLKNMGVYTAWKADLFTPMLIDKKLEDYL